MYLPPLEVAELEFAMPESVALLYMPMTLHHAFLEGQRVSQLAYRGAQQLQRKLVWFYSGWLEETSTRSIRQWIEADWRSVAVLVDRSMNPWVGGYRSGTQSGFRTDTGRAGEAGSTAPPVLGKLLLHRLLARSFPVPSDNLLATARSRLVHFRPIRSGHCVLRSSCKNT